MNSLFVIAITIIVIFIIRYIFIVFFRQSFRVITKLGNQGLNSSNKIDVFYEKELLTNKEFIEEFKQLIEKKGGLYDFIRHTSFPIQQKVDYTQLENSLFWYGFESFAIDSNDGLQLNKNAVNITKTILNFNSFDILAKKNKLSDKDINYIGNTIFLIILKDFGSFSKKYLFK